MLKLDLTGHSSHVSFSRNILSSSSRALRGWKDVKIKKKKKGMTEIDMNDKVKRKWGYHQAAGILNEKVSSKKSTLCV